jgi:hypothetical protein
MPQPFVDTLPVDGAVGAQVAPMRSA